MTATIKELKAKDLGMGCGNSTVYPITVTTAVLSRDEEGEIPEGVALVLEDRLETIESTLKEVGDTLSKIVDGNIGVATDDDIESLFDGSYVEDGDTGSDDEDGDGDDDTPTGGNCDCESLSDEEIDEIMN